MLRIPYATLYGCINAVRLRRSTKSKKKVLLLIQLNSIDIKNSKQHSEHADNISDSTESEIFKEYKENEQFSQELTKKFNAFFKTKSLPVVAKHVPCKTKDASKSRARNKMWIFYEVGRVNMDIQEIGQKIKMAINCTVNCLENHWDDIQTMQLKLKSSSGQSYKLF